MLGHWYIPLIIRPVGEPPVVQPPQEFSGGAMPPRTDRPHVRRRRRNEAILIITKGL